MIDRARRQIGAYLLIVVAMLAGFWIHSNDLARLHDTNLRQSATQASLIRTQHDLIDAVTDLRRVNRTGTRGSCMGRNRLRNGIVGFAADTQERSRRASVATLASPTATDMQKRAALQNYAQITMVVKDLKIRIPLAICPPSSTSPGP